MLALCLVANAAAYTKIPGKYFVADTAGDSSIIKHGRRLETVKTQAIDVKDPTVLETKKESSTALALSNGVGIYVDEDSRMEMKTFQQEVFQERHEINLNEEVSLSEGENHIPYGNITICAPRMQLQSTHSYSTPNGRIKVLQGRLNIQQRDGKTKVSLLAGEITLYRLRENGSSEAIKINEGEQVTFNKNSIVIEPLNPDNSGKIEENTALACQTRKTVFFQVESEINPSTGEKTPSIQTAMIVPLVNPTIPVSVSRL